MVDCGYLGVLVGVGTIGHIGRVRERSKGDRSAWSICDHTQIGLINIRGLVGVSSQRVENKPLEVIGGSGTRPLRELYQPHQHEVLTA